MNARSRPASRPNEIEPRTSSPNETASSQAGDAVRTLRALVEAAGARSVLLVGVDRPVGAVAARLANAMAGTGRRTILVDADFGGHDPTSEASQGTIGLATWLADEISRTTELPIVPSDVPNLSVIRSGATSDRTADALDGPQVEHLMPALTEVAERVVIAGGHLAGPAAALPLARRVDVVILCITAGRTTRAAALRARDELVTAGGTILGVVLDA